MGSHCRKAVSILQAIVLSMAVVALSAARLAAQDLDGSQDHPRVGRYEGSVIKKYSPKAYDELFLMSGAASPRQSEYTEENSVFVSGKLTTILYEGPAERSALEVVRNYQRKLESDGFETVFFCRQKECGDASAFWSLANRGSGLLPQWQTNTYVLLNQNDSGQTVWVSIFANEFGGSGGKPITPQVLLTVVESQAMEDDKIVVRDASAIETALAEEGRIALYGIYFDFDKTDLKEESAPQLEEIASLLRQRPELQTLVVGHTDNKGALEYNESLSKRRAESVVNALVSSYGIARSRLTPLGVGMAAPIASNQTEEGRAKNRRVEIVAR